VDRAGGEPWLTHLAVRPWCGGDLDEAARAGTFPNAQTVEFPLAAEAARFYRSGPPLLQRYLPFWLANLPPVPI